MFQKGLIQDAIINSFKKLDPRNLWKTPVIFCVEISVILVTIFLFQSNTGESFAFTLQIAIWLWFTVLFANFAEAIAESRGKHRLNL
jgi:K+-transporting ATPase ATPase B chain